MKKGNTTELFDNFKKKRLLDYALSAARDRPGSQTAEQELSAAMVLNDVYDCYRRALKILRQKKDEAQIEALRAQKTLVDEDVAADPRTISDNMLLLLDMAQKIEARES